MISFTVSFTYSILGLDFGLAFNHFNTYRDSLIGLTIITLAILTICSFKTKGNLKWVPISILSFSSLLTATVAASSVVKKYVLLAFLSYYILFAFSIVIFVASFKRIEGRLKLVPILFSLLSIMLTLYVVFMNALWSYSKTFI